MNCPDKISTILLEIITVATLNIRREGNAGEASRCAVEADHIHNLPALLGQYNPSLLDYYWTVERPAFLAQVDGVGIERFEPMWSMLKFYIDQNDVQ